MINTGSDLQIARIEKSYANVRALVDINLTVKAGEFLTLLGASGSGKTTLLRIVAGFEKPNAGVVRVGSLDITELPPEKRNIGMVFQNYALFPHLTVRQNIAFPLQMRQVSTSEQVGRIREVLSLVGLEAYGDRLPSQLSGGQQQRVALARAIVFNPSILLLDEPFGALDRKLRENLQVEVRKLQQKLGLTALFITHDQEEALAMSDRIALMQNGKIAQISSPSTLYLEPSTSFVADFVGESNIFTGRLAHSSGRWVLQIGGAEIPVSSERLSHRHASANAAIKVLIRPEAILVDPAASSAQATFDGVVREVTYLGPTTRYQVDCGSLRFTVRSKSGQGIKSYAIGDRLQLGVDERNCHVLEA